MVYDRKDFMDNVDTIGGYSCPIDPDEFNQCEGCQ